MIARKIAYCGLGVMAWALENPFAAIVIAVGSLFIFLTLFSVAKERLPALLTNEPQSFAECVLNEMQGQPANLLRYAEVACRDRTLGN